MQRCKALLFAVAVLFTNNLTLHAQTYTPNKEARKKLDAANGVLRKDELLAFKYYEEAAATDPNWVQPHWLLAADYMGMANSKKPRSDEERKTLMAKSVREWANAGEIQKAHPQMSLTENLRLIDLYGVALAQNGNLEQSIAIYRQATKESPDYPSFHYNLACGLAETGDLDGAIAELQKAWKLRFRFPPGEFFEDPHKDSSFKRYFGDPKFEAAVRGMK